MIDPFIEAWDLRELVRKKEVRPREVAEFFLARIEKLNPKLGAFMTVAAERALAAAARLEKMNASEAARLPLFGVAYSLKDLLWTKDIRTTFGSKNYENWHAPADAELAVRLANSGGILLGKTTTPEFGLRPTTEGGLCPPARNPWNLEHTAGGSSGGAASAVAAGLHPIAQGSDGGGSVRIPRHAAGWSESNRRADELRARRQRASRRADFDHRANRAHGSRCGADARCDGRHDAGRSVCRASAVAAVRRGGLGASEETPPRDDQSKRARRCRAGNLAALESACGVFREMGHSVEPIALDPGAMLGKYARVIVGASVSALNIPNPDLLDPVVRGSYERA